jgi:hypothetical protein
MPLVFLPLLGSGFVAVESMPAGLRWFAEHQPFTPIMSPRSWTPSVYCWWELPSTAAAPRRPSPAAW